MEELLILRGPYDVRRIPNTGSRYVYRINSPPVTGLDGREINDAKRLHDIAEQIRDRYANWIYSLNKNYVNSGLFYDQLSLFFLGDLSCKRAEVFETFDTACNLLLIKEKLRKKKISRITLVGADLAFLRAIQSTYPAAHIYSSSEDRRIKHSIVRRILSDCRFLLRVILVSIINIIDTVPDGGSGRCFFSVFPKMFEDDMSETKYGALFQSKYDQLAVSLITDDMHQRLSMVNYLKERNRALKRGLWLIDGKIKIVDAIFGFYWMLKLVRFYLLERRKVYQFDGIDLSDYIRSEARFSASRIVRLMVVSNSFRRFFIRSRIKEFVYYPYEYPFGRMISWVLSVVRPDICRTGYQMGPVSWRRMEEFMATGEASASPPYMENAPIPNIVYAEDLESRTIFEHAGYKNVEIMDDVYRYSYLNEIRPKKLPNHILIAPGLHDGELMMNIYEEEIRKRPEVFYLLKVHPRATAPWLERYRKFNNIEITNQPISELLSIVSRVVVTYSSVGIEASRLGLDVTFVDIPGKINTSPLYRAPETDQSLESPNSL